MKIIKLEAQAFKRLRAVEITPDGNVITITGKNGAGKSSVLDAIEAALGGVRRSPAVPIREGEEKARIVCELDDITVTRSFTQKGSSLKVEAKDGTRYARPQEMLDKLVGELSFDPLEFSRMEPKAQRRMLEELTGVNVAEMDIERAQAEQKRTQASRSLKSIAERPVPTRHHDAPEIEVDVNTLMAQLREARRLEDDAASKRRRLEDMLTRAATMKDTIARLSIELLQANDVIAAAQEEFDSLVEAQDVEALEDAITTASAVNRHVAENRAIDDHQVEVLEATNVLKRATKDVSLLDIERRERIRTAVYPVAGLGFDAGGVIFNDIPFAQLSSAEQLRVSVAMGIALNPTLKILLIRDGSLLDSASLAVLGKMAAATDSQVWLERVSDGERVGVVIEDGCSLEGGAA